MATAPFGGVLEGQLKEAEQGGLFHVNEGFIITPASFCCVSGRLNQLGVYKDPVALAVVDKTMACINEAVTVDYSGSWSPSGTINTWQVDWGDGNISGGAFPGAGSVAHPGGGGGYALPGIYTITLTVTDLLGAVGTSEIQIEIVDCTLIPDIEAFCGCGASGVWYTITGGRLWTLRGLAGVEIYDLKVMPFSVGLADRVLWAATANGLYRSEDDGNNWTLITLPEAGALAVAISPSRIFMNEVFVAATVAGAAARLYRTLDEGATWESVELRAETWTEVPNGLANDVLGIGYRPVVPQALFAGGSQVMIASPCDPNNSIADWINPGPWGPAGNGLDNIVNTIEVTPGGVLYAGGTFENSCAAPMHLVARWTGVGGGWAAVGVVGIVSEVDDLAWDDANGLLYAGGVVGAGTVCQVWNGVAWASVGGADELNSSVRALVVNQTGMMDPIGTVYAGGVFTGTLLGTTISRIGKWDGANWTQIGGGVNGTVRDIQIGPDGYLYICGDFTVATQPDTSTITARRVVRWNGTEFEALGDGLGGTCHALAVDDTGRVFVGGSYTTLGDGTTAALRIAAWDGLSWTQVADGFDATVRSMYWSPNQQRIYAGGDFTLTGAVNCDHIAYLTFTNYQLATVGRTHIVDVDAGDSYAYVGVLTLGGLPRILRVRTDMTQDPVVIYATGFGTWGGIRADWNLIGRVWYFGDFGAPSKVLLSEDWGSTEVDLTDAGWGAGEVVRPVMPSVYNPSDVIAILNIALDSFQSGDDGATWAKTGDPNFAVHCGERDWIDPRGIFIGNMGPAPTGPQHLRYTLNRGVLWLERSTAITANAPVVAIQIVG